MRPRYLDRYGIDGRATLGFLFAWSIVVIAFAIGCEIPLPPVPTPEPPPVVVTTDATVIVIEETADRDFDTASILGDIAFWTSLGVNFRLYDDDSPDAAQYLPLVKDRPGMLVLDKNGKKIWGGRLPKTTDEIKRLLK